MSEQKYPEPTVGALIVNSKGDILLCRSRKWFGKLTVPGGHIELGETAAAALKREVKEEVGLDIEVGPLLITQEFIFDTEFSRRKHFIFLDYLCFVKGNEVRLDEDEMQSFEWVGPRDALMKDTDSYTRRTIEAYLKMKKP